MTTTKKQIKRQQEHPTKYLCQNPETHKFEEVFPESEIGDTELVIPLFWAKDQYVTVPGTEFYGPVPEERLQQAGQTSRRK